MGIKADVTIKPKFNGTPRSFTFPVNGIELMKLVSDQIQRSGGGLTAVGEFNEQTRQAIDDYVWKLMQETFEVSVSFSFNEAPTSVIRDNVAGAYTSEEPNSILGRVVNNRTPPF